MTTMTSRRLLSALLWMFAFPSVADLIPDPVPESIGPTPFAVRLAPLATGLTSPNWGIAAPGVLPSRMFVTDQPGYVWSISIRTGERFVFLNVRDRLVPLGIAGPGTFDSRGVLGLAFHPQYASNGLLYTYTSEPPTVPADFPLPAGVAATHLNVVTEWRVPSPGKSDAVVDPASARVLMRIAFPSFDHNGGCLNFGADGLLYISIGDGGNGDDQGPGHSPQGNAQDPSNPLGKILRINPLKRDSPNGQYGIPTGNPFVGVPGFLPEIYAYGLRNPWRFSFDTQTHLLYASDAGQASVEEIDLIRKGGNYGWRWREGGFFFDPNGDDPGFVTDEDPGAPEGLIDPIAQYDHDEGRATIGGFVYRGTRVPYLAGRYIFGDFSRGAGSDGRLLTTNFTEGVIREVQIVGQPNLGFALMGFGQDSAGEIYALGNLTSLPTGATGVVAKILPTGS
jgi:glucose/arabinose dehydrogenase